MTQNEILNKLNSYRPGSFVRVTYRSDVELSAAATKAGNTASKIVHTTVRLGCKYANLKVVKEAIKCEEDGLGHPISPKPSWKHSINRYMSQHNKTEQIYLNLYPIKNAHVKAYYTLNGNPAEAHEVKSLMNPSALKSSMPTEQTIKIENIISIG